MRRVSFPIPSRCPSIGTTPPKGDVAKLVAVLLCKGEREVVLGYRRGSALALGRPAGFPCHLKNCRDRYRIVAGAREACPNAVLIGFVVFGRSLAPAIPKLPRIDRMQRHADAQPNVAVIARNRAQRFAQPRNFGGFDRLCRALQLAGLAGADQRVKPVRRVGDAGRVKEATPDRLVGRAIRPPARRRRDDISVIATRINSGGKLARLDANWPRRVVSEIDVSPAGRSRHFERRRITAVFGGQHIPSSHAVRSADCKVTIHSSKWNFTESFQPNFDTSTNVLYGPVGGGLACIGLCGRTSEKTV
jgi:hypothetical protein